MEFKSIFSFRIIEAERSTDAGKIGIMTAEEHELAIFVLQLLTNAAHQRIGKIDGSSMSGEEQPVIRGSSPFSI